LTVVWCFAAYPSVITVPYLLSLAELSNRLVRRGTSSLRIFTWVGAQVWDQTRTDRDRSGIPNWWFRFRHADETGPRINEVGALRKGFDRRRSKPERTL